MTVNTVLFLETKSVLAALKDSGARIGIISTKFRYRIKELLDQHFPEDFLDIIIGGEDVQTPKPSPEGLLLAIRQLHATKAETLYIGDSTVDAETAQKAGVDFAGITHGMTTAEELKKYPHKKNNEQPGRIVRTGTTARRCTSQEHQCTPHRASAAPLSRIRRSLLLSPPYIMLKEIPCHN